MKTIRFAIINILFVSTICCTKAQSEQQNSQPTDFIQEKINDNLYVLKAPNYNTNVGVFIGSQSVLLIDPMTGNNNQETLLSAIKRISLKPIEYVLNTHSHSDHSGANSFFANLGATVIAQENSKYTQAKSNIGFTDNYIIEMGNETIELHHIAAHTFDDALIHFKKNNTIFMGDTYMTNSFPHFYYGGGSEGHFKILDKALSLGDLNAKIISAHGKLISDKKQLQLFKENSIKWVNRINKLHTEGKETEKIIEDNHIKQLALILSGSENVMPQTIEKTISVDMISSVALSKDELNKYEGAYTFENGQICEVILDKNKLIFRKEGDYIYEIIPVLENKFHVKGQFPYRHVTFNINNKELVYFDGNKNLMAKQ